MGQRHGGASNDDVSVPVPADEASADAARRGCQGASSLIVRPTGVVTARQAKTGDLRDVFPRILSAMCRARSSTAPKLSTHPCTRFPSTRAVSNPQSRESRPSLVAAIAFAVHPKPHARSVDTPLEHLLVAIRSNILPLKVGALKAFRSCFEQFYAPRAWLLFGRPPVVLHGCTSLEMLRITFQVSAVPMWRSRRVLLSANPPACSLLRKEDEPSTMRT